MDIIKEENIEEFEQAISEIVDVDKMLRYIAVIDLIASAHVRDTKNFKMYYNPKTNRFEPIAWDVFEWFNPTNNKSNLSPSIPINHVALTLFERLLEVPEYVETKNNYILEFIGSFASCENITDFIDNRAELIREKLYEDPIKNYTKPVRNKISKNYSYPLLDLSNQEWKDEIVSLKERYCERVEAVGAMLQ